MQQKYSSYNVCRGMLEETFEFVIKTTKPVSYFSIGMKFNQNKLHA